MKRRVICIIVFACLALVAGVAVFLHSRSFYESNLKLRDELRAEVNAWLASLPPIPPDSENGATLVLKGLEIINYPDSLVELERSAEGRDIRDENDAQAVRSAIATNEGALQLIEKGLAYEQCVFPYHAEEGIEAELPDVVGHTETAKLLAFRSKLAFFEGRKSDACRYCFSALRLGTIYSSVRDMLGQLLEAPVYNIGLNQLAELISDRSLTATELKAALEELLELYSKRGDFASVYRDEHMLFAITLADLIDGLTGAGKHADEFIPSYSLYFYDFRYEVEAWRKWHDICCSVDPARFYSFSVDSMREQTEALWKEVHRCPLKTNTLVTDIMILPRVGGSVAEFARTETRWRGVIVLAAVRRCEKKNGHLPENLTELGELVPEELLTDPFSGSQLVYRPHNGNFSLYSVGPDKTDGSEDDIIFHTPQPK